MAAQPRIYQPVRSGLGEKGDKRLAMRFCSTMPSQQPRIEAAPANLGTCHRIGQRQYLGHPTRVDYRQHLAKLRH